MDGYMGKALLVDLGKGSTESWDLPQEWYKDFQPYSERNIEMRANNIAGYRTFVWKRFANKGSYQVVLYSQTGELIAARKFIID